VREMDGARSKQYWGSVDVMVAVCGSFVGWYRENVLQYYQLKPGYSCELYKNSP
jgi:hypothetical protein